MKNQCFACFKQADVKDLKRCARCRGAVYCSTDCQRKHWSAHKEECDDATRWWDKYKGCKDGSMHEGKLELMNWDWKHPELGTIGWGNTIPEDVPLVRAQFENECRGKKSVFFKKRPHAFRWTCCGVEGSSNFGCDHHGTGRQPCTCDFCRMGRPQPESIYNDKAKGSRIGLNLPRGPDPRSFDEHVAAHTAAARSAMGLAMKDDDPAQGMSKSANLIHQMQLVMKYRFGATPA